MTGSPDQYAGYIGTEEGIFEKYGIVLETTEYAYGINTIDAVQNGTADTGNMADFALVNRIGNTIDNTNLVIFSGLSVGASTTSTTISGGLYVAPEYADDLTKLYNSPGIITCIGTVTEYNNWQALTYIGLEPDAVATVNATDVSTQLATAKNGEAAAMVASGSTATKFEELGWVLVATSNEIGISTASYLLTTTEFLADNTETLAKYMQALDESLTYIMDNLSEASVRISEKFDVDADTVEQNLSAYIFNVGLSEESVVKLENVGAWALAYGKYPTEYSIRDFIDLSAARIAFPDSDKVTAEID